MCRRALCQAGHGGRPLQWRGPHVILTLLLLHLSKCRPRAAASRRRSCRRCGAAAPRSRGAAHQPDQARHQHNLRPLQILHRGPVSFPARVLGRPRHRLKVELVAFRASHRDDSGCLWCFREEDWNAAFNYTFNLDFLQQCLVETRGKSANR